MNKLRHYQTVLKSEVTKYKGEIIKNYGDGSLCLFSSVLDAVHCAKSLQETFRSEPIIPLRIGLHLGDVMYEENDIYSNDLNIASRIESMGISGAVLMSKNVLDKVKNQADLKFSSLGSFEFKNVEEPMEVFALANDGFPIPKREEMQGKLKQPSVKQNYLKWVALIGVLIVSIFGYNYISNSKSPITSSMANDNKSIAVLPFKNWSGNDDLEYFCDGMTDEIIARLTNISAFEKVTSRTSAFKYKNSNKSIPEIAKELRVNHILEGSFQKVGSQLKIKLQLIDALSDDHLWSHEYSGDWASDDIFQIQADVAETVIKKMNISISSVEMATIQQRPTDNKEAYDLFLLAEFQRRKNNEQSYLNAIPLYQRAIELDDGFAEAYTGLGTIYIFGGLLWGVFDEKEASENADYYLNKAYGIKPSENISYSLFSLEFYYYWNFEYCEQYFKDREGSKIIANIEGGVIADYFHKTGKQDKAFEWADQAIEKYPLTAWMYSFKAKSLFLKGEPAKALLVLKEKDQMFTDDQWYLRESAILHFYMGNYKGFHGVLDILNSKFVDRSSAHIWLDAVHAYQRNELNTAKNYVSQLIQEYNTKASGSPAWFIALYYFYAEDIDKGFEWLQNSYDNHEVEMTWLQEEYLLRPYRDDPRYQKLYNAMGWPQISSD
jgi:TolB-like protein